MYVVVSKYNVQNFSEFGKECQLVLMGRLLFWYWKDNIPEIEIIAVVRNKYFNVEHYVSLVWYSPPIDQ